MAEYEEVVRKTNITGPYLCSRPGRLERVRQILDKLPSSLVDIICETLEAHLPVFGINYYLDKLIDEFKRPQPIMTNQPVVQASDPRIWDRENITQQLNEALLDNKRNLMAPDTRSHKICTALGLVGLGKTTVGRHVANKLMLDNKPVKYVFVDFSNGDRLDEASQLTLTSFSLAVSMSVITGLFANCSYQHARVTYTSQPFNDFKQNVTADSVTLSTVLQKWYEREGAKYSAVVLHFDEINYLTSHGRQHLITYIGEALTPNNSTPVLFLPLLTGTTNTAAGLVRSSKFGLVNLALSPLSHELDMTIEQNNLTKPAADSLKRSERFQLLLKSSLGIPRIVMQLHQAVKAANLGERAVKRAELDTITEEYLWLIDSTYNIDTWMMSFPSEAALLQLICLCLRGTLQLQPGTPSVTINIPGLDSMSKLPNASHDISVLYDEGYFYTRDTHQALQHIEFPYILLASLVSHLPNLKLSLLSPLNTMSCLPLAEFEPKFLELLVRSFNAMQRALVVSFSDIWRGAKASTDILNIKLKIPQEFVTGTEERKWIKWDKKSDGYVTVNFPLVECEDMDQLDLTEISGSFLAGPKNELFDVRTVFDIADDEIEDEPLHTVVEKGTRKRKATSGTVSKKKARKTSERPKMLLNLVQMTAAVKANEKVKASAIHAWYNSAQSLNLDGFTTVFTYYTHRGIEWDKSEYKNSTQWTEAALLRECPRLVLMSRDQLTEYLSPTFAPLCRAANE